MKPDIHKEARELYRRVYAAEHQRRGMVWHENKREHERTPLAHKAATQAYEDYLQLFGVTK